MENEQLLGAKEVATQWAVSTTMSLSASLVFGKERASEIARPHLSELFKLTQNDQDQALLLIKQVEDFSVKRLLLGQFRHCYILSSGDSTLSPLLDQVDFADNKAAMSYDRALLRVLKECNSEENKLSGRLRPLPLTKRRAAIKRLKHEDFKKHRKISFVKNNIFSDESNNPVKWWHWGLIIALLAAMILNR
ncbi:hypothetical protein N8500_08315 [Candidatus Puniceispirillum sp.]|nr:hypothetical protein [Candidatus Puniceispirillum sp.]